MEEIKEMTMEEFKSKMHVPPDFEVFKQLLKEGLTLSEIYDLLKPEFGGCFSHLNNL